MSARPVLIGMGGGLIAVLALAPATGGALGTLASARGKLAAMRAQAAAPVGNTALVQPGLPLGVRDVGAGRAAIVAKVQQLARSGGVLVEETGPMPASTVLAAVRIRLSGSEKAVVALADALERGRPMIRLRGWRLDAAPGGGVRLTGEAVAAWR
jgi:hypothetical protein